jgi:hypothetical protein
MGLFKQMKDLRATVAASPALVEQAMMASANAQQMAMVQQSMYAAPVAPAPPLAAGGTSGDFSPICGVSLEQYVEVSRGLAAYNYDQSKAVQVAGTKGINAMDWTAAMEGWNHRMRVNPAVARQFNALYTGR